MTLRNAVLYLTILFSTNTSPSKICQINTQNIVFISLLRPSAASAVAKEDG